MNILIILNALSADIGGDFATAKSLPEVQSGATELTSSETSLLVIMLMTPAKQGKKKTALV